METPVRDTEAAEKAVIATFADMTMDDYLALVAAHPDIHYRFNAAGDVLEMPNNSIHAQVQAIIGTHFTVWLWTNALPGHGALVECLYDLGDWRCCPDVAIDRQRVKVIPREAPLLAVEIRSDSNTWPELREKAARYLEHGTQMVWLVDMDERAVELHRAGESVQTLAGDDLIDGGAVLPGFRLPVSDLFPNPQD
ncbi:MAG: Uma2 family endonuclease [Anaerolineaceae bacterium]|nr:Uma2 family endonuclease [Anaerolineaceae bacterium]